MKKQLNWQIILTVCIFVIVVVNFFVVIQLSRDVRMLQLLPQRRESLPCGAIPTRYIIEEPTCANKLLRAMNVTNVHILSNNNIHTLQNAQTIVPLLNLSAIQ